MALDGSGYPRATPAVAAVTQAWGAQRERPLGDHLPYVAFVGADAMMLRGGDLMATLALDGVDPMTTPDRQLDALKRSLAAIVAQTGSAFGYVVHRLPVDQDLRLRPIDITRNIQIKLIPLNLFWRHQPRVSRKF